MSSDAKPANGSLLQHQAAWLDQYRLQPRITECGRLVSVGDGIAWISGLPTAAIDDLLNFADGSQALVFDLNQKLIGAILLHASDRLTAGTEVSLANRKLSLPVGPALVGRVIDPLGLPLDGEEVPEAERWQPLEQPSAAITARDFVHQPLYTGNRIIDTLIPIGRGQRQLLIGDEGLGRSSLALDTLINQKDQNVLCIYVMIGQRRSNVIDNIELLRRYGALDYTTVIVAEGSALPGLQHLAPFAGCALAEYWMQQGRHTLVVYDDLSTHAKTYRELSLLLRRPPGREADQGGGSMTALPIVETNQGEIEAYIPTNLISITDGQVYLDAALFSGGFRPAIDIGKSVSRIGGNAQHPAVKHEAGRMKLDYLQFLELEVFTRFGSRLEASMETAIRRGRVLREILKQQRLSPEPIRFQLAWMIAFNEGMLDEIAPDRISPLLLQLSQHLQSADALDLDSSREQWQRQITDWIHQAGTGDL